MGEFKKRSFGGDRGGDRGGFKRDFGGRPSFGGSKFGGRPGNREFRQSEMFTTTCAECKKSCEVPFRPNGEKPVYCNYCFGKNKAAESGSEFPRRDAPRNDFPRREFTPASAPVARPQVDNSQINDLKRQLDIVTSKLDKMMELLKKSEVTEAPKATEKAVEKVVEKKVESVKAPIVVKKLVAGTKKVVTAKKPVSKKK